MSLNIPFHLVSDLLEVHQGVGQVQHHHKPLSHRVPHAWYGLDWHPGLEKQTIKDTVVILLQMIVFEVFCDTSEDRGHDTVAYAVNRLK